MWQKKKIEDSYLAVLLVFLSSPGRRSVAPISSLSQKEKKWQLQWHTTISFLFRCCCRQCVSMWMSVSSCVILNVSSRMVPINLTLDTTKKKKKRIIPSAENSGTRKKAIRFYEEKHNIKHTIDCDLLAEKQKGRATKKNRKRMLRSFFST